MSKSISDRVCMQTQVGLVIGKGEGGGGGGGCRGLVIGKGGGGRDCGIVGK